MRRPAILPLSDGPGFIPCGPGRPMTPEQREAVFGAYGPTFVRHLAEIVMSDTSHPQPNTEPKAANHARRSA